MTAHALAAGSTSRTPDTLLGSCAPGPAHPSPGIACRLAWDITHSGSAATLTRVYLAGPVGLVLKIAFVLVLAFLIRALTHRAINRITTRAATLGTGALGVSGAGVSGSSGAGVSGSSRAGVSGTSGAGADGGRGRGVLPERSGERRRQRSHALGSILRNASTFLIFGIAGITILGDLGINLAPVLASAGVLGVALGFGAQNLVGDFLAGISILLEDQYGVGDVITVGLTTGTVEAVGLRVTRMRDVNGVVWHIRNGSLQQVGNQSQGWARAVIDVPVPYNQDMSEAREIMTQVATNMWQEPEWEGVILEEPKVWGVQSLSSSEAMWRLVAMTTPPRQYEVERALRERIMGALDARGLTTPVPTTIVALAGADTGTGAGADPRAGAAPEPPAGAKAASAG
jgi:moderate conductance mechanosensitive channel